MKYDLTRAPEAARSSAPSCVERSGLRGRRRRDHRRQPARARGRGAARRVRRRARGERSRRADHRAALSGRRGCRRAARGARAAIARFCKSALDAGRASAPGRDGVLIVDTLGELGRLYAASDVAFVGGSLFYRAANKGGHNLMEPAILAVPVLFGPYNFSFKETVEDLLAANAGAHDPRRARSSAARSASSSPTTQRAATSECAASASCARGRARALATTSCCAGSSAEARLQPPAFDSTMPRQLRTTCIPVATRGYASTP